MNALPHASVLGCVDRFDICSLDTKGCWNSAAAAYGSRKMELATPFDQGSPLFTKQRSLKERYTILAISLALEQSHIYNAIRMRGSSALEAQSRVGPDLSTALDPEQFKIESAKMFRTSLARAQIELLDIANGAWADVPEFENHMNSEQMKYICKKIQVKASNKKGITVRGLLLILVACVVIPIMSIDPGGDLVILQRLYAYAEKVWAIFRPVVNALWSLSTFMVGMAAGIVAFLYQAIPGVFDRRIRLPT